MNGTEFIVRIDHQGTVLQINGQKVPWGATPFKANPDFGQHLPAKVREHYGIEMGQRVLPERPEGVPENAVLGFVYVTPEANTGHAEVYNLKGEVFDWRSDEAAIERYGVTFPEPEPTPESVIDARIEDPDNFRNPNAHDLIAALGTAGFEIVRKADFRVAVAPEGM